MPEYEKDTLYRPETKKKRGKQSRLRSGYLSERRIQCLKNMMNIWKNTGKL